MICWLRSSAGGRAEKEESGVEQVRGLAPGKQGICVSGPF